MLPSLMLLPSLSGGADICAELFIRGEGVVARTATGEVVINNTVPWRFNGGASRLAVLI